MTGIWELMSVVKERTQDALQFNVCVLGRLTVLSKEKGNKDKIWRKKESDAAFIQ